MNRSARLGNKLWLEDGTPQIRLCLQVTFKPCQSPTTVCCPQVITTLIPPKMSTLQKWIRRQADKRLIGGSHCPFALSALIRGCIDRMYSPSHPFLHHDMQQGTQAGCITLSISLPCGSCQQASKQHPSSWLCSVPCALHLRNRAEVGFSVQHDSLEAKDKP